MQEYRGQEQTLKTLVAALKRQFVDGVKHERAADVFISIALGREPKRTIEPALRKLLEEEKGGKGEKIVADAVSIIAFELASRKITHLFLKGDFGPENAGMKKAPPEFNDAIACAELLSPESLNAFPTHSAMIAKLFHLRALALHMEGNHAQSWEFYNRLLETAPDDVAGGGGLAVLMTDWALNNKPEKPDEEYMQTLRRLFDELTIAINKSPISTIAEYQSRAAISAAFADLETDPEKKREHLLSALSDLRSAQGLLNDAEFVNGCRPASFSCVFNTAVVYLELAKLEPEGSKARAEHLDQAADYNALAGPLLKQLPDPEPQWIQSVEECRREIAVELSKS